MKTLGQRMERSCGAIVFRFFKGALQVLLVRHSAGHWSFPKGHAESHETDDETVVREVFEETGVEIEIFSDFVEESTYEPRPGIKKTVRFFIGDYVGGELLPQLEEVSNAEWMTSKEACELLTFDRDREIFTRALSHIGFAMLSHRVLADNQEEKDDTLPCLSANDQEAKLNTFTLKSRYTVEELLRIMRFLRSDEGCPWDREQTHESIAGNMLEEAYEAVDAITSGNMGDLCDELGDVLMQVVFHASMADDEGFFDFSDVVSGVCRKLISRHSHLFGDDQAVTPEEVLTIWNKNKDREKGFNSVRDSMEAVSLGLPALTRALKLQKQAARVGFDWPDASGALDKVKEEFGEFCEALTVCRNKGAAGIDRRQTDNADQLLSVSKGIFQQLPNKSESDPRLPALRDVQQKTNEGGQGEATGVADSSTAEAEKSDTCQSARFAKRAAVEEAGDLLFAVVNALRLSGIDPETALTMASEKFIRRFSEVERLALLEGSRLESMTLEEMDVLWNQVKLESRGT